MRLTAQKSIPEQPMSNTRHLSDLKFDERPYLSVQTTEAPRTDVLMLAKADAWMGQFKTRLNISVIALLLMWGAVSYYKSTSMQLAAHAVPEAEKILADGSADETSIATMNVDTLKSAEDEGDAAAVETVETVNSALVAPPIVPKAEVKKTTAPKATPQKNARAHKKLKKSVASKAAP